MPFFKKNKKTKPAGLRSIPNRYQMRAHVT